MHQTSAPKTDSMTLTIKTPTVGRGHMAHRSGAGKHGDRRNKRLKTRATRLREAMRN